MTRDANQIAQEYSSRLDLQPPYPASRPTGQVPRGTLTIWDSISDVAGSWLTQSQDVTIDVSKPGIIIAYDENNDVEIFYPMPGWYVNFIPNRHEGE